MGKGTLEGIVGGTGAALLAGVAGFGAVGIGAAAIAGTVVGYEISRKYTPKSY